MSNYIHYKVWGEITYSLPNFNGAAAEIWEWVNPTLFWACDYFYMLDWKLIHVDERVFGSSSSLDRKFIDSRDYWFSKFAIFIWFYQILGITGSFVVACKMTFILDVKMAIYSLHVERSLPETF